MQTAEEQLAQLKAETRFRDLIEREALMTDVMPRAIRHVVRDAADVFELKDDQLVPKHGDTDPGDPLTPLSPSRWLQQLKTKEPFLFVAQARTR
jgi:hypothetical protein